MKRDDVKNKVYDKINQSKHIKLGLTRRKTDIKKENWEIKRKTETQSIE